jgi:hypothetical protein
MPCERKECSLPTLEGAAFVVDGGMFLGSLIHHHTFLIRVGFKSLNHPTHRSIASQRNRS